MQSTKSSNKKKRVCAKCGKSVKYNVALFELNNEQVCWECLPREERARMLRK